MEDRPKDIDMKKIAKGTCQWLLRHDTYTQWNASDRSLLWIKGKPGSGKSTLLRYAFNNAIAAPSIGGNKTTMVLSFFFHGRGTQLQKSPLGLFRALLNQVLLFEPPDPNQEINIWFEAQCKAYGKPGIQWEWHLSDVQRFFEQALSNVSANHPVLLFIDALDECGEENASRVISWFQQFIRNLSRGQIRLCFGCRHYPVPDTEYGLDICLERENDQDILTFVETALSGYREIENSEIPKIIHKGARGVFMWARLAIDRFQRCRRRGYSLDKIQEEILAAPQDLYEIYEELVQDMKDKKTSWRLIQWIFFAERPLNVEQLQWAMVLDCDAPNPRQSLEEYNHLLPQNRQQTEIRLTDLTAGLAELTSLSEEETVVQFIHQSVKDYFNDQGFRTLQPEYYLSGSNIFEDSHQNLAKQCLHYIGMKEFEAKATLDSKNATINGPMMTKYPLLKYAVLSWAYHSQQSTMRYSPLRRHNGAHRGKMQFDGNDASLDIEQ
ncbi:hypothetical protein CDD82_7150 [Ophiocordyceps australis]|uniref:Uncharacterized protein n=1 Tax=Ophiocordyceps australis TaxID=1399860 RepID=A0A2C5Y2E7_9HYPO|nr:hypothetical protein CDD82_7150 [Ophiocordyceps australis]